EAAPRRERLAAAIAAEPSFGLEPDEGAQMRLDPSGVVRVGQEFLDRAAELRSGLGFRVLFEDPRLRLHDLREGPERDAVAVGQASPLPPRDQLGVHVGDPGELVDQPALAHTGDADQRDELRNPLVPRAIEGVAEDRELTFAPYELRPRVVGDVHAEARRSL